MKTTLWCPAYSLLSWSRLQRFVIFSFRTVSHTTSNCHFKLAAKPVCLFVLVPHQFSAAMGRPQAINIDHLSIWKTFLKKKKKKTLHPHIYDLHYWLTNFRCWQQQHYTLEKWTMLSLFKWINYSFHSCMHIYIFIHVLIYAAFFGGCKMP